MKKEEQIRMLLHPEDYTDEQLDQMLDETDIIVPDADEAWEKFRSEKREVKSEKRLPLLKIAAMFVGVLMLSGIAYAAYRMVSNIGGDYKSPTQEMRIANSCQQVTNEEAKDSTAMKPVVYEDAELATILNEIASISASTSHGTRKPPSTTSSVRSTSSNASTSPATTRN